AGSAGRRRGLQQGTARRDAGAIAAAGFRAVRAAAAALHRQRGDDRLRGHPSSGAWRTRRSVAERHRDAPVVTPKELLRKYGLHAKKSWGQNFLVDEKAYQAIVEACRIEKDDVVIEIGAGLGTLTARLAEKAGRVIAVERDRDMVTVLRGELADR